MKKCLVIGLLVIAVASSSALAVQKGTSITVNPIGMLVGLFNAEVNLSVAPTISVPIGGSYFGYKSSGIGEEWEYKLMGLSGGLRYYWQGNAVNGWYLGGKLNYFSISVEVETTHTTGTKLTGSATASAISYGALIGYQSIWNSGFTLDFGLGVQLVSIPSIDAEVSGGGYTEQEKHDSISLTVPMLQFAIGYAF